MKHTITLILLAVLAVNGAAGQTTASEVLSNLEDVLYPDSFYLKVSLETTEGGSKKTPMVLESWYKEGVGTRMEILEPSRTRGTTFLQKNNNLWMYNPRSRSRDPIRLSPKASFQGSVFSNNDMGDPEYLDDYTVKFASNKTESIEHPDHESSVRALEIICSARNNKSPYSRIIMWCMPDTYIPLKMEYYSKSGYAFRRMVFTNVKALAGRQRPAVFTMYSLERENTFTRLEFIKMEKRPGLADRMFTKEGMKTQ